MLLIIVVSAAIAWCAWPRSPQAPRTRLPLGDGTSRAALEETITTGRALLRKARVSSDARCAIEAEHVLRDVLRGSQGSVQARTPDRHGRSPNPVSRRRDRARGRQRPGRAAPAVARARWKPAVRSGCRAGCARVVT